VHDLARLARLARLVVLREQMADLLAEIHEHAVEAAGGVASALLVLNPRTGQLLPASASGLDHLEPGPCLDEPDERALVERAFHEGQPLVVPDAQGQAPSLADLLGMTAAILIPLASTEGRLGILAIGLDEVDLVADARPTLATIGDLAVLALERARLRRDADVRQDVRALVGDLSRSVSSALNLTAGLEVFCDRASRLFAADTTSVWLHDRRARVLQLAASSDPAAMARGLRVPTDDPAMPVSAVMRRERAEMVSAPPGRDGEPPAIYVPLRGRRRALGTLVIEGARADAASELDLLDRADEVGRQLSAAIDNVQLLEDVLRSRRELDNTFNSIADLVAVCDTRLRLVHVNRAFAARLGWERHEAVDRPLDTCVSPVLSAWVERLVVAAAGDEAPGAETREFVEPGLGGTFHVTVSPLLSQDGELVGAVLVARDVTEQARLEAERLALRDRLTQSEKLAALGQFVAGIAHELNNPLQGVLGHVELLRATGHLPAAARRDLRLVYREADRAAKIVRNLLVFAGSRTITRRRMNLNRVVQRATGLRSAALRALDIELVRDLGDALPQLAGDALLLQQALLNILVNAEQALAEVEGPRRLEVRTWLDETREVLGVQVSDNGPGLSAAALPRIFEPFFTTKEVGRGTGLGLAIAYGIVQEHGGRILPANRQGGGASFIVELPLAEEGTITVN